MLFRSVQNKYLLRSHPQKCHGMMRNGFYLQVIHRILLHLGLHWGMALNVAVKKHMSQRKYQVAGFIIGLLTAAYGVYVFIKRNFLTYMLLRSEFVFLDYEEPKLKFFLDYLALMGLCIFIAHYIAKLFRRVGSR